MHVVARTFRVHLRIVRSYPAAMLFVLATFLLVLYCGRLEHRTMQAIGYIAAVWLGAFVTDLVVILHPRPGVGFPIRQPVWRELAVIFVCTALGFTFLAIRFSPAWPMLHGLSRAAVASLLFFAYPIALALIYLLVFRYRPSELGFNIRYWYLPVLIHLIVGGITLCVAPDKSHWRTTFAQTGLMDLLFTGIICAALSEEFLRMLLQTRLGSAFQNKGTGFVLATLLWAAMHIPNFSGGSTQGLHYELTHVWTIAPLGFLWGYLTHRTKSLLPAVLVHGLNLWGLQIY